MGLGTTINNATIQLKIGSAWSAGAATYSSSYASAMAFVRKLEIKQKLNTVDTRGAGATRVKRRPTVAEGMVTLSGVVPTAGYTFQAAGAGSPVGLYVSFTVKPHSAMSTADTYEGIIVEWTPSMNMDDATIEEIVIDLDFDAY
jgi:hypothetical protein